MLYIGYERSRRKSSRTPISTAVSPCVTIDDGRVSTAAEPTLATAPLSRIQDKGQYPPNTKLISGAQKLGADILLRSLRLGWYKGILYTKCGN